MWMMKCIAVLPFIFCIVVKLGDFKKRPYSAALGILESVLICAIIIYSLLLEGKASTGHAFRLINLILIMLGVGLLWGMVEIIEKPRTKKKPSEEDE